MSLLSLDGLSAYYGDMQALYGVCLEVLPRSITAIIGPNGAGKSTLMKSVIGGIKRTEGNVVFDEKNLIGLPSDVIASYGISIVPEGRRLFPSLTVEENLLIGNSVKRTGPWSLKRIYELFPNIAERKKHMALELSGGQQQMVAFGRALMTNPSLLLCDEISLGLAPAVVEDIYSLLPEVTRDDTTLIIIEQDVSRALGAAEEITCLMEGRVVMQGSSTDYTFDQVAEAYFAEQ